MKKNRRQTCILAAVCAAIAGTQVMAAPWTESELQLIEDAAAAGEILTESSLLNDGKVIRVSTYEYDEKNRVVKIVGTMNDKVSDLTEFSYDENGNLLNKIYTTYNKPVVVITTDFVYDDAEKLVSLSQICEGSEAANNFTADESFTYDDDVLTERSRTTLTGKKEDTIIWSYEYADQKIIEQSDSDTVLYEYVYDDNDLLTEKIGSNDSTLQITYENGVRTAEEQYAGGQLSYSRTFSYEPVAE